MVIKSERSVENSTTSLILKKKNNAVEKGNYFLWHVSLKILDKMFMSSKSEYIKFIKWISIILTKKNS